MFIAQVFANSSKFSLSSEMRQLCYNNQNLSNVLGSRDLITADRILNKLKRGLFLLTLPINVFQN